MKKNTLIALVLALLAMASTTAFGQACTGTWAYTQNAVTNTWSVGAFTPSGSNSGCYLATPTIDPTYTGAATPTLGNGITTNSYTYVYTFTLVNGVATAVTTNPAFYPYTVVNGLASGGNKYVVVTSPTITWYPGATTVVNGVSVGNGVVVNGVVLTSLPGYGIPANGIQQPNYGTGYNGVGVTNTYVLGTKVLSNGVVIGGPPWTGVAFDRSNGAAMDVLGGHGASSGCMNCHTPHNSGRLDATTPVMYNSTSAPVYGNGFANGVTGNYFTNAAAGPFSPYAPTNTPAFIWKDAGYGQQLGGSMNPYLWNHALTQVTYTTWDGASAPGGVTLTNGYATSGGYPTISQSMLVTGKEPVVHTLLCLSCHDNSMSSHGMTNQSVTKCAVPNNAFACGFSNGQINEPGAVTGTVASAGATVAWGAGSLAANHPVHAVYPADGGVAALGGSYYWMVTPNANGTVTFVDNDTNQIGDSGFYGHPARLYSDGTTAWVECTSCHNPHRMTSPAWLNKSGKYTVGAYGTTTDYIRGPFSLVDGTIASGFCRSCHYSKSPEYVANGGAPK